MFYAFKSIITGKEEDITGTGEAKKLTHAFKGRDVVFDYEIEDLMSKEILPFAVKILKIPDIPLKDKPNLSQADAEKIIEEHKKQKKPESYSSAIWRHLPLTDITKPEDLELKGKLGNYYYGANLVDIYPDYAQRSAAISRMDDERINKIKKLKRLRVERALELALHFSRGIEWKIYEINAVAQKADLDLINDAHRKDDKSGGLKSLILSPNTIKNALWYLSFKYGDKFLPIFKSFGSLINGAREVFVSFLGRRLSVKNWNKILNGLEEYLRKNMIGQRKLIKGVVNKLREYFATAERCALAGVPFNKGLRIILRGEPGIGKTYLVQLVARYLNVSCALINMADIIDDRGLQTNTIVDRLMKSKVVKKWFGEKVEKAKLEKLLSNGPRGKLIVIDETDKMNAWERQKQGINTIEILKNGGKLPATTLQELLRVYVDEGKIGEYDARFCLLFECTNASREDINNNESSTANRELMALIDVNPPTEHELKEFCITNLKEVIENSYKKDKLKIVWDENDLYEYTKFLVSIKANWRLCGMILQKWVLAVSNFLGEEENKGKKNLTVHWDMDREEYNGIYVTGE